MCAPFTRARAPESQTIRSHSAMRSLGLPADSCSPPANHPNGSCFAHFALCYPVCFHANTNCPSCNSFLLITMQIAGGVGVCVATEAVAAGAGELHGSFAYLPGRRPLEFGFAPCRAFSAWRQLPHPHQVEGDGGEGELCGYFSKPAHPESPHPSLLFQDAEDRLDHRFSSSVQRSPGGGIQLFSESPMRRVIRVIHRLLQLPTAMQSTSHVAIRDIRVDAAFLHDLEVVQREKA